MCGRRTGGRGAGRPGKRPPRTGSGHGGTAATTARVRATRCGGNGTASNGDGFSLRRSGGRARPSSSFGMASSAESSSSSSSWPSWKVGFLGGSSMGPAAGQGGGGGHKGLGDVRVGAAVAWAPLRRRGVGHGRRRQVRQSVTSIMGAQISRAE